MPDAAIKPWRALKDAGHVALGAARYRFGRPRTVVLILSSMRSGSTLLKALLAEAPDVSNLPEVQFAQYRRMHPYKAYDLVCRLSEQPIVILKRPVYDGLVLPFPPSFLRMRIVLLVRNALDVGDSVMRMTREKNAKYPEPWDAARAIAYWRDAYSLALEHPELGAHAALTVKYEDLVREPERETARVFEHIGSVQRAGVRSYQKPRDFQWQWGSDDGGARIASLAVTDDSRAPDELDPTLEPALRADPGAVALMQRLGYALPWERGPSP